MLLPLAEMPMNTITVLAPMAAAAIVQALLNMSLLLHIPINLPPKEPTGFELLQEINQPVRPMKRYSV